MKNDEIITILRDKKLIFGLSPEFKPLTGGVSSDIFLITDESNKYVVKQALEKLRVQDDWFADISRNQNERQFIRFMEKLRPESVPNLIFSSDDKNFFVMEFLDEEFRNWKKELLNGIFDANTAKISAELLAEIHNESRENEKLKNEFNKGENFYTLRISPYLVTTGERYPDLKKLYFEEAERLKNHREALVHGDFSPKNIMVKNDRVVLLDHEVAWFGDPAFDVAFFLNHLYLKMLYHYKRTGNMEDLTGVAWNSYFEKTGQKILEQMEQRTIRLLLLLMLARIDGKSPVEYFEEDEKEFVRHFVKSNLPPGVFTQEVINQRWKEKLKKDIH